MRSSKFSVDTRILNETVKFSIRQYFQISFALSCIDIVFCLLLILLVLGISDF